MTSIIALGCEASGPRACGWAKSPKRARAISADDWRRPFAARRLTDRARSAYRRKIPHSEKSQSRTRTSAWSYCAVWRPDGLPAVIVGLVGYFIGVIVALDPWGGCLRVHRLPGVLSRPRSGGGESMGFALARPVGREATNYTPVRVT